MEDVGCRQASNLTKAQVGLDSFGIGGLISQEGMDGGRC